MGGKRTPMSGGSHLGGGDLVFPTESIYHDFTWEVKRRKKIPEIIKLALAQATQEAVGSGGRKMPASIIIPHGAGVDATLVAMRLDNFVQWTTALAEVGQSSELKSRVRAMIRDLQEMEKRL